jgi:hypothetical protein
MEGDMRPRPYTWDGRDPEHFGFRTRWQIVRRRSRSTWADWRADLVYLIGG